MASPASTSPAPPDTRALTATTVRVLPPEEFERLRDMPFASRGMPDPRYCEVLVAEDPTGEIVGIWAALTTVHLDGLWVAPEYRRATHVAAKLLRAMKALLVEQQVQCAFTLIEAPEVLVMAMKAGFTRLPHDVCFLDLSQGDPSCR